MKGQIVFYDHYAGKELPVQGVKIRIKTGLSVKETVTGVGGGYEFPNLRGNYHHYIIWETSEFFITQDGKTIVSAFPKTTSDNGKYNADYPYTPIFIAAWFYTRGLHPLIRTIYDKSMQIKFHNYYNPDAAGSYNSNDRFINIWNTYPTQPSQTIGTTMHWVMQATNATGELNFPM